MKHCYTVKREERKEKRIGCRRFAALCGFAAVKNKEERRKKKEERRKNK
ncbi:MAG: hypothetical protein ACI4RP_04925 [Acutalibacteraceae bacterium]